ncbi:MAG: hypothetical protein AABY18_07935 [Candidatus Thermoplasmatota archaeon]
MASWARTKLLAAAAFLLLALLPWPAQAGTQTDPEFTDDAGDPDIQGFPIGPIGVLSDGIDLLKGWVEENATALVLALEVAGDITLLDPATSYQFDFHLRSNGTDYTASATWEGAFAAGGVAASVAAEGSVLRFTVPKSSVGAFRSDVVDGLYAESSGTLISDPLSSLLDRAPDSGMGRAYNVTQGFARGGSATDVDGDGLADAKEVAAFGNITAQNGTGDPDSDGLNNTREFDLGTDPTKADTDGDLLKDGEDTFPLDKTKPVDSDGDGLTDTWERTHFTTLTAQNGAGDPDSDGLNNTRELALGTDPNKADTDGDGLEDGSDPNPLTPAQAGGGSTTSGRKARPELYSGAAMFAVAATFILLGLAKGI